jgi:hypothetical protein
MTLPETPLKIHYTEIGDLPSDHPIYLEYQTYRRALPDLLARGAEGKFALVKGDEIIGIFADEDEAFQIGYDKYLRQPFLVQPIREWEPVYRQFWSRLCRTSPSR